MKELKISVFGCANFVGHWPLWVGEEYPMGQPRELLLTLLMGYGLVLIRGRWKDWGFLGCRGGGRGVDVLGLYVGTGSCILRIHALGDLWGGATSGEV